MNPSPGALRFRAAGKEDAEAIAILISALGYPVTPDRIRTRVELIEGSGRMVLVADLGRVVGVLTTSVMTVLHRPRPVGRISMFVVEEGHRGAGIGRAMLAEAERRLAAAGCGLVEVTSNRRRARAHLFYERLGYECTSYRFAKDLAD